MLAGNCPKCKTGMIVERNGRFGAFYGCFQWQLGKCSWFASITAFDLPYETIQERKDKRSVKWEPGKSVTTQIIIIVKQDSDIGFTWRYRGVSWDGQTHYYHCTTIGNGNCPGKIISQNNILARKAVTKDSEGNIFATRYHGGDHNHPPKGNLYLLIILKGNLNNNYLLM